MHLEFRFARGGVLRAALLPEAPRTAQCLLAALPI